MKMDNDEPCPNCGRTDGSPDWLEYTYPATSYLPACISRIFACSHCVVELAKRVRPRRLRVAK